MSSREYYLIPANSGTQGLRLSSNLILWLASPLRIHGKSRMRKMRMYGSVRGALSDERPYRDS